MSYYALNETRATFLTFAKCLRGSGMFMAPAKNKACTYTHSALLEDACMYSWNICHLNSFGKESADFSAHSMYAVFWFADLLSDNPQGIL